MELTTMKKTIIVESGTLYPISALHTDGTPCEWVFAEAKVAKGSKPYCGNLKSYVDDILSELNAQNNGETFSVAESWAVPYVPEAPYGAMIIVASNGDPVNAYWCEEQYEQFSEFDEEFLEELLDTITDRNWQVCARAAAHLIKSGYDKDDIIDLFPVSAKTIDEYLK